MASWFTCKPCTGSDPACDTVKVDLGMCEVSDKENAKPVQFPNDSDQVFKDAKERRFAEEQHKLSEAKAKRRREEEAEAQRQSLQEQLKKAADKLAQEKARQEVEEQERQAVEEQARQEAEARAQEEALAAAAAAEEERLFNLCQEAQRKREEKTKRDREDAQQAAELAEATARANKWCKTNGFHDLSTQKKTFRGATKFPLHTAVKYGNEDMVGLLLQCGVDKNVKDSRNQTPYELAVCINKNGSHDLILALFQ